jgi:hypothetical protein
MTINQSVLIPITMWTQCFQDRNISNTVSVDYHERGIDYRDGVQPKFGNVHHEMAGNINVRMNTWRMKTHQIVIRSFVPTEISFCSDGILF